MTARRSLRDAYGSRADQETDRPVVGVTAGITAERSRPYKLSISLPPATYIAVQAWLTGATQKLGRKVDTTKVGEVLFAELVDDEALSARVLDRLREHLRK